LQLLPCFASINQLLLKQQENSKQSYLLFVHGLLAMLQPAPGTSLQALGSWQQPFDLVNELLKLKAR